MEPPKVVVNNSAKNNGSSRGRFKKLRGGTVTATAALKDDESEPEPEEEEVSIITKLLFNYEKRKMWLMVIHQGLATG